MQVVTGAFGYIGRYIARQLVDSGETVRTITTHPDRPSPFGNRIEAFSYNFDQPRALEDSLRGAEVLYNTYWVRFDYGDSSFEKAVQNTKLLFECAKRAGVKKVVHISVTNASLDSRLPYYRGKALQEKALADSGLRYAIVRPTLVFGIEDILVNNIAWLIRKFPIFPIFGSGEYELQPVYVGDLAEIAIAAAGEPVSSTLDAVGPETYSFKQFAKLISATIKPSARFVHVSPALGVALGRVIGLAMRDVVLTKAELRGLMDSLLTSGQAPNGQTKFSDWLPDHKDEIGTTYTSELGRHFRWRRTDKQ